MAVNKWDLVTPEVRDALETSWGRLDELLYRPLRVNLSAASGRGVQKLLPAVEEVRAAHHRELGTGEVNRLFERALPDERSPRAARPPRRSGS